MTSVRHSLIWGLRAALARPLLLLPLYGCSLLLGLLQTWPVLAAGMLYNPLLGDLAGNQGDMLADVLMANPARVGAAALWVLAALPLGALFGLAYNFFAGGVLSVYAGTRPFWAGSRRTFLAFTGLGLLLLLLVALAVGVALLLGRLAGATVGVLAAALLLQFVNVWGEYARALAVTLDQRNPLVLLRAALRFFGRNPGGVLALALVGLLLHAALAACYTTLASAPGPLAILGQQLALLAWLWIKLLRLAWALGYVRLGTGFEAHRRS